MQLQPEQLGVALPLPPVVLFLDLKLSVHRFRFRKGDDIAYLTVLSQRLSHQSNSISY